VSGFTLYLHPHSFFLPSREKRTPAEINFRVFWSVFFKPGRLLEKELYLKNNLESKLLPTALFAALFATLLGFPLETFETSFAARAAL